MTQTIRSRDLNDDETVVINSLVKQLDKKRPRNRLRSGYYDGRRAVKQIGAVIPPMYAKLGLALGWAAKGVDGLGRRCTLEEFVLPGVDMDTIGWTQLQESNFLLSELSQGRTDCLIHGVSYLVTTSGDEAEGEPAALVHAKDALNAIGDYNDRKRRLDNLLSVTAWNDREISAFSLYIDGETISAENDGGWKVTERTEHPWHVPAEQLVYRPRSSRRVGKSRISRPVMSHQDSALRALVRLEAHMDVYAIPKLILLGASESIFKNTDGSTKASWQVALARAFGIPDDEDAANPRVDVKQFDAQSPEPHLADLNALAKLMARETDLPDSDFALTDMANPTSADSYTASRENLINEAEGAMSDWSPATARTVKRALAMQEGLTAVPESWAKMQPKWRNPIYLSKSAAADAGSKQLAAVPWLAETEVGLELLGLDKQQIERAMAEKRRAQAAQLMANVAAAAGAAVSDPKMRSTNAPVGG